MGNYLAAPITEKESEEGQNERLAYGLSAMQGWRISMEDAHISNLDIDGKGTALFAVFDGHGGKAVAKFAAKHMPYWVTKMEAFTRKDFGTAIAESYYKLDELLDTEEGQVELRLLSGAKTTGSTPKLFSDVHEHHAPDSDTAATTSAKSEEASQSQSPEKSTLHRINSSEKFRASALLRHSVIPADLHADQLSSDLESLESMAIQTDVKGKLQKKHKDGDDVKPIAEGMGCTAVSVLIHNNDVTVANTGDSRCVISRRGEAVPLTLDHKPIIYEEAQRIIKAGGFVKDNRINGSLNVSRTIGDLDFKRNRDLPHTEQMVVATPDITDFHLGSGDEFLVLACDGIWDVLSNQEAVDFVRKRIRQGVRLKDICEQMCDFCLAPDLQGLCRGADNMSVIVVLFKKHADLDSFWYRLWSSFAGLFRRGSDVKGRQGFEAGFEE